MIPNLKPTGEPCAVKVACTVRGRVVGKVPHDGNSLATYSTQCAVSRCDELPSERAEGSSQTSLERVSLT
jgi:hypothetical protein